MSDEMGHREDAIRATGDPVAALVRSARHAVQPDPAVMERAMQRVHGEWHAVLARRRRAKDRSVLAAAAAIVVVTLLAALFWPKAPSDAATVARVTGDVVERRAERGELRVAPVQAGRVIVSGEEIDTGSAGRALLTLVSGEQLRIDNSSLVRWMSPSELSLARGTVYIETGTQATSTQVTVSTPFGAVRHVGTRFEVQVADGHTRVRVRDGAVIFSSKYRPPLTVNAGQQLAASEITLSLQAGPGSADSEWAWTRDIAPDFSLEGRSLYQALDWLGHESGLRVEYENDRVRSQAQRTTLRGSLEGLDTRDALRAVLTGSELKFEVRADRIDVLADRAE